MTHKSIPGPVRRLKGVPDSLIRLSVGLEEVGDLVEDLEQAFHRILDTGYKIPIQSALTRIQHPVSSARHQFTINK
jgi:Cys/Met metabolism PLP-dependent enzyme